MRSWKHLAVLAVLLVCLAGDSAVRGANWLAQLNDVRFDGVTESQVVTFRNGKWRNEASAVSCNCPQAFDFEPELEFAFVPFVVGVDAFLNVSAEQATYELVSVGADRYVHWRVAGRLLYESIGAGFGLFSDTIKIDVHGLPSLGAAGNSAVGTGSLLEPARNETSDIFPVVIHAQAFDADTLQLRFVWLLNKAVSGVTAEAIFYVAGVYKTDD